MLGEGKTPSIGQGSSGAYVVWQRDGEIMLTTPLLPQARSLGKGAYPKIRVLRNENAAVCVWEQEGKIKIQRVD